MPSGCQGPRSAEGQSRLRWSRPGPRPCPLQLRLVIASARPRLSPNMRAKNLAPAVLSRAGTMVWLSVIVIAVPRCEQGEMCASTAPLSTEVRRAGSHAAGLVAGQPVGCGERTVRANTSVRPAGCLGRCTRKYLSRKPPSRAGSAPPQLTHIRSAAADGASTPTTLYFAPQLGQLNGVGLRWGMSRLCRSSTPSRRAASTFGDLSYRHRAEPARQIHRLDHDARRRQRGRCGDPTCYLDQVQIAFRDCPDPRTAPALQIAGRMSAARSAR
jgi:hypothetical protein